MSDRDTKIKEMADLLMKGATMLSYICPECKVPLFRLKDGEIICPSCKRKAVFQEEEKHRRIEEKNFVREIKVEGDLIKSLKTKIYEKITYFIDRLDMVNDINDANQLLSIIERLIKIFKEL
ncbi:MAG: hypothetical protein NZ926_01495 [Candidatus Methanomethylicia archaeon]|nr:hypothetical protein [Candidatus Methanomethylicia archaeon]MCX8169101.1 hypothetical protein [Candidatus Methanomethylicia archaeon]MDW7988833.1 Sjogren's syndrome/scleroderma autoantigen 1 family protein [Nitrososphaerota archaeon]